MERPRRGFRAVAKTAARDRMKVTMRILGIRWVVIAALLCVLGVVRPAPAQALVEGVSKELEYIDALMLQAADSGQVSALQTAHNTLSILAATAKELDNPRDRALTDLSIAYFYVRMCGLLPLLQLSSTTNPEKFNIDCAAQSTKYFESAIRTAIESLDRESLGDTHFYTGVGYDALRHYLAAIPGSDTSEIAARAQKHVAMAVQIGTSFDGAKTVLAKFAQSDAADGDPVIDEKTFLQVHRMFYMEHAFPQPPGLDTFEPVTSTIDAMPTDEKQVYLDYRWRFSIQKPDDTWSFATSSAQTTLRLTVFQPADVPGARPPFTLVAQQLADADTSLSLRDLVTRSTTILVQAGYSVETQKEIDYRGKPAYEIVLTYSYKDLGIDETPPPDGAAATQPATKSLDTRHYMLVVLSSNIQYILSFSSLKDEYSKIFPDLKMIANTFTPF